MHIQTLNKQRIYSKPYTLIRIRVKKGKNSIVNDKEELEKETNNAQLKR
tara:strand:+ start:438 stop:584 length:147 start_codon:yes stop_codon:yes gene_type:complete